MTVGHLLNTISSRELTEWVAYESEYGQLGDSVYDRELLRQIHVQIQALTHFTGAINTGKGESNPVPEPKMLPLPNEWKKIEDDEDEE